MLCHHKKNHNNEYAIRWLFFCFWWPEVAWLMQFKLNKINNANKSSTNYSIDRYSLWIKFSVVRRPVSDSELSLCAEFLLRSRCSYKTVNNNQSLTKKNTIYNFDRENMSLNNNEIREPTIPEFYAGKNIFITGGTGFLGTVLIEALLSATPKIGNIYLLIRDKYGSDTRERIKRLLSKQVNWWFI